MLRVTLANIRAHKARLVAVTLATTIAVAFLAAVLILNSSMQATFRASIGAEVAKADLIVSHQPNNPDGTVEFLEEYPSKIEAIDGVEQVFAQLQQTALISSSEYSGQYISLVDAAPERFNTSTLEAGRLPEQPGEFALDVTLANQLKLTLGDSITLNPGNGITAAPVTGTVVGIVEASASPFAANSLRVYAPREVVVSASEGWGSAPYIDLLQVGLTEQADSVAAQQAITQLFKTDSSLQVTTVDEYVSQQIGSFTGASNILLVILLVFVTIALFVAALVIGNTFSVLVAQRTRELALLRSLGASKRQVFGSVLLEALVVGLVAGVLGVALGLGVMAALAQLANSIGNSVVPSVLGIDTGVFIWPILVGVVVVLLAAISPARTATRVAPIAAMRPSMAPTVRNTAGKARLSIGLVFFILGGTMLGLGAAGVGAEWAVLWAIGGALLNAIGVFMLAVFAIPATVAGLGRVIARFGVPAKLAGLNAVRNPRRTATTASALLIGVTLVTTVYTGAEVANATVQRAMNEREPIDAVVQTWDWSGVDATTTSWQLPLASLTEEQVERIAAVDGVAQVLNVPAAYVSTGTYGVMSGLTILSVSADQYRLVSSVGADELAAGAALVNQQDSFTLGEPMTFSGPSGTLTVDAVANGACAGTAVVTPEQFAKLQVPSDELGSVALIRIEAGADFNTISRISTDIAEIAPTSSLSGGAMMRSLVQQIISVLLTVMSGLLAVAILIAIVGIGNTLSLSVIERTRENALLRALGLTKRQLRALLSIEAVLIAATAAILGSALGVAYGYLGAASIFTGLGQADFIVPWLAVGIVIVLATLAGLLSSVLPARRAAKLSPIAGLATE